MRNIIVIFIALALSCVTAPAQEAKMIRGPFCDTKAQIIEATTQWRFGKKPQEAMDAVNVAAGKPSACGFAFVLGIIGEEVASVEGRDGLYGVVEVTVLGGEMSQGFVPLRPPVQQFTVIKKPGATI